VHRLGYLPQMPMTTETVNVVRPSSAVGHRTRPTAGDERCGEWLREYRATGDRRLRNLVVEANLHIADYHVRRFSRSVGVSSDDLRQTALMGIIHAVERFDPDKGVSLRTFASRTIEGELKRYLRDRSWAVRPPRRVQELHLQIRRSTEEMSHRLGRPATIAELSEELDLREDQLMEGLGAEHARSPERLDAPSSHESSTPRGDQLGAVDTHYATVDHRAVLGAALATLDRREQQVLHLRFVEELSQPEIAEQVGVSQSYVSRILRGSLSRLRLQLAG